MQVNFERGILQIEDARIIYRNFKGEQTKYNREGDRNFAVVISSEEIKDALVENGWNVKIRQPRTPDESVFMYLPVKVKFNNRGPAAYVISGNTHRKLDEESIEILDDIDILSVNMDLRGYDWEVNGKTGRSAYLQAIEVIQNIDRFGARYENDDKKNQDDLPF